MPDFHKRLSVHKAPVYVRPVYQCPGWVRDVCRRRGSLKKLCVVIPGGKPDEWNYYLLCFCFLNPLYAVFSPLIPRPRAAVGGASLTGVPAASDEFWEHDFDVDISRVLSSLEESGGAQPVCVWFGMAASVGVCECICEMVSFLNHLGKTMYLFVFLSRLSQFRVFGPSHSYAHRGSLSLVSQLPTDAARNFQAGDQRPSTPGSYVC